MTTYAIPTVTGFESFTLTRESRNALSSSPFTFSQQVLTYPGQRWVANVTLPPLNRADADVWRAFFVKLNGQEHTFTMGDPLSATAKGEAGGTPLLNGAITIGDTIIAVDGASVSQTDWLKAGDYIQIGTGSNARLYMVLDDVDTNGSGEANINVWPSVQVAAADNASVVVSSTVGCFRLNAPSVSFETGLNSFTKISFSAVSVV